MTYSPLLFLNDCLKIVVAQKGDDKVELSRTTFTVKQQSKKNAQQQ